MGLFWKAAAAVLITVVLQLTLGSQGKDIGLMLTMAVCCMVCVLAVTFLEPVLEFLQELNGLAMNIVSTFIVVTVIFYLILMALRRPEVFE